MSTIPAIAAAEIVSTEDGKVLWVERYVFSRMHGKGESFIRDSKAYLVMHSTVTRGQFGGVLVEHVVKLVSDRTAVNGSGDQR